MTRGRVLVDVGRSRFVGRRRPPRRGGLRCRRRDDEAILSQRRGSDRPCCSLDSIADAAGCARSSGAALRVNLEPTFAHDVIDDFVSEYAQGRTPIPCVRCNTFTKFRDLVRRADAIDARYVATGHYARAANGALTRGRDPARTELFPLGDRSCGRRPPPPSCGRAHEGRDARARTQPWVGCRGQDRESGICFVPDGDHVARHRASAWRRRPRAPSRAVPLTRRLGGG